MIYERFILNIPSGWLGRFSQGGWESSVRSGWLGKLSQGGWGGSARVTEVEYMLQ
uniref:Uncharacterized protein n=1 Tax=Helianthus annuus TaxID=4232 RepID=A0A251VRG0_HELAN